MSDTKYNGWSNRETWLVNLWLTNEEPLYLTAREIAQEGEPYEGAEALEAFVDGLIEENGAQGFFLDLLNAALARVDWREVAEHLREE